jgi:hypothetical protein
MGNWMLKIREAGARVPRLFSLLSSLHSRLALETVRERRRRERVGVAIGDGG